MSRIVSERTCRGNTRSRGKRKRGKESKSTTTTSENKSYWQKRKQSQSSYKGSKKGSVGPPLQHKGRGARLCGHNPAAGKTPKWEAKDNSTQTGCPLGLTKTHQAARQEAVAVPPPSSQKYSSEPTTTKRWLSTRLSARALEPKEAHSRQ